MDNYSSPIVGGSSTILTKYCQACGQALGYSWVIEGGLEFHPWCAPSKEALSTSKSKAIIEDALENKISWLEFRLRTCIKERDEAQQTAKNWREQWEKERIINCARRERLDDAVAKLYEWVGETYSDEE
jgi:hypothetical protein